VSPLLAKLNAAIVAAIEAKNAALREAEAIAMAPHHAEVARLYGPRTCPDSQKPTLRDVTPIAAAQRSTVKPWSKR
jgi:NAD(P)H-hydrate repair Nnr-like enzyme with NAD(P)H-hydrate dehydratase domain